MSVRDDKGRGMAKLVKACAIVLAIVCAVPGVDAIARAFGSHAGANVQSSGFSTDGIRFEGEPLSALDQIEDSLQASKREAPDEYLSEVGLLAGAESVRVDDSGSVIGYCVSGEESEVLGRLEKALEEKGWTPVPLGGVAGATFVKQGGDYTWMLATCTQVGETTSVVTRCMKS